MAKVNISDVEVLDNPATFLDKFKFKITFECYEPLEDDLEWKVVYVGSAYNSSLDQTLDSILVGPIPVGRHQFVFEVDPPDPSKIPNDDIVGVTVVLIQALYHEKEFIRIGYYVCNEYKSEEMAMEPPAKPVIEELKRTILTADPRVTRFAIDWGDGLLDGAPLPEVNEELIKENDVVEINDVCPSRDDNKIEDEEEVAESEEAVAVIEDDPDEDPAVEIDLEAIDDEEDAEEDLISEDQEDVDDEEIEESGSDEEEDLADASEGDENDDKAAPESMDVDTDAPTSKHQTSTDPGKNSPKAPLKQL